MMEEKLKRILENLHISHLPSAVTQFCAEEDGSPYQVWKLNFGTHEAVLKKTTQAEREVYETFLIDTPTAPRAYGFTNDDGELYMLMEYIPGETMSFCTRKKLIRTLDALIAMQDRYWENTAQADVGYSFQKSYPNREKRLPFMADLSPAYEAYLEAFRTVPRTLCNDDMLPINVVVSEDRAVILDWEFAGILPYPCALMRLIAFGEEKEDTLFHMTDGDKAFALDYYYENFIASKHIGREAYDRTMKLFLLKEYSEWVYCAHSSGDLEIPYYKPYYELARRLAAELKGETQ